MHDPPARRRRAELGLLLGGLLAGAALVGGAEALARRLRPTPCPQASATDVMACLHVFSPVYGWDLRPGVHVCPATGCISVNAEGRRGPPLPSERTPGRRRVLVLGDSVAFGLEVADGEAFPARLDSPSLEVVNMSVPGFGTDQELLKLEREGAALHPDVVLLSFTMANDLADVALPVFLYDGVHRKPYFRWEGGGLRLHDEHLRLGRRARTGLWLREHSVLYNLAAPAPRPGADGEAPEHWLTRYTGVMAHPAPLVDLGERLVLAIRERARAAGARFVIAFHPTRRSFEGSTGAPERELASRLRREGVSVVWLEDEYKRRGLDYAPLAVDGLGHLSRAGHAATAAILRETLEAN